MYLFHNQDQHVLGHFQNHLNLVQQQVSEFKENFNMLSNIPNQVEVIKTEIKSIGEELKHKSSTPPPKSPNTSENNSDGVLMRTDIEDLKKLFTESQLGKI